MSIIIKKDLYEQYEHASFRNAMLYDVSFMKEKVEYSDTDIPQWLSIIENVSDVLPRKSWVVKRGSRESIDIMMNNTIMVHVVYEPMDITSLLQGDVFIPSIHHINIQGIRHFTPEFQSLLSSAINAYIRTHILDFMPDYYVHHLTYYTLTESDLERGSIAPNNVIVRGHLSIGRDMYVLNDVYRDVIALPPHDELKEHIIRGESIPTAIGLELTYPSEWSHNIGYAQSIGKLKTAWWSQLWHI